MSEVLKCSGQMLQPMSRAANAVGTVGLELSGAADLERGARALGEGDGVGGGVALAMALPAGRAGKGLGVAARELIQRFANRRGIEVTVVGSRARGTARADSDYDYVIGGTSRDRSAARRELPRGSAGGEVKNGRETGMDVFNGNREPVDPNLPHVTFKPEA
jgi:hypothetical protein